jgi:hypothetical protein
MKDTNEGVSQQAWEGVAASLRLQLEAFLLPLLVALDERIDKRLVRTLVLLVGAIIELRHPGNGLVLSELGGYLLGPEQAPAGTKRISNLLRSDKWHSGIIERFFWQEGDRRVSALHNSDEAVVVVWDESVVEKPESRKLEGLCAVRSSKAKRLTQVKPGFYTPPGRPIFVPGMNWVGLLVMGMTGAPVVAAMRWWTTRGQLGSDRRSEETKLLYTAFKRWGTQVLHVFDRGFAGAPWLRLLLRYRLRFVMRWQTNYLLLDAQGRKRKAWEICRGQRSLASYEICDARRRGNQTIGVYFTPVTHPDFPTTPLWLVVSRQGSGHKPWYLLTNQPVASPDQAFCLIRAYARRWQIEMAWRYAKSDLAFQSPRLWSWHNRLKLLLIASLAYAFLLSLLAPLLAGLRILLLRHWCHRTGERCREASTPLYRLRTALARLWTAFLRPPALIPLLQNSG